MQELDWKKFSLCLKKCFAAPEIRYVLFLNLFLLNKHEIFVCVPFLMGTLGIMRVVLTLLHKRCLMAKFCDFKIAIFNLKLSREAINYFIGYQLGT